MIDIKYCGVCHTDIHMSRNGWGGSVFPMVPGHEITGVVSAIGDKVTKFKVGDRVGVGCFYARHGIVAEIETIRMQQINQAFDRILSGDVRFRFVIDMATLDE